MPNHIRVAKALMLLLASMTIGAIILMLMGHNPPSAGPFSLSIYYHLDPVKNVIISSSNYLPGLWDSIEIYYSGTESGNIKLLTQSSGIVQGGNTQSHFCICNGNGGKDGLIQSTEKWKNQSVENTDSAIRICIIADQQICPPTDCQIKRLQVLLEELCRRYNIKSESVQYPDDWT